jgi:P27 family predicted phage terminase small subunit
MRLWPAATAQAHGWRIDSARNMGATVKAARRGHKSTVPTALKRLRATEEQSRVNRYEPVPEVALSSEPPHWFTDDQQTSFRYAMTHSPRGLLKAIDRGVLEAWCTAESRHRTAAMTQARLDAGKDWPMLQPGKDGRAVISPYVTIQERAELIMLRCADALGFTPASRPRIQLLPGAAPPPVIDGEVEIDPWHALGRLHRDAA